MKRWKIAAKANFLWQVARNVFVGPSLTYDYAHVIEIDRPELLDGQDRTLWNLGVGLTLAYDSRDVITRPTRGVYATVTQLFHPKFMGSGYAYTTTDFRFNTYAKLWRGAVIGGDLRGTLNFGNPSWAMMSLIGNSSTMRGYYKGRYRDKHKMLALAQADRIIKRLSREFQTGFVDVKTPMERVMNYNRTADWPVELFTSGSHLSELGNLLVADTVYEELVR